MTCSGRRPKKGAVSPYITIARFRDLHEAWLAEGKLKSAGVDCILADDNLVRMDWLYANAIGGVKLQVREEDAASAQELLEAEIPALLMDDTAGEIYQQPQCPRCDSFDIGYGPNKAGKILSWLVLGFRCPSREESAGIAETAAPSGSRFPTSLNPTSPPSDGRH